VERIAREALNQRPSTPAVSGLGSTPGLTWGLDPG
jgi:hypothetical protein